jgi:catechol 2,3-dioxygenase-like lactoylglutathione lyase family enzyme
VNIDRLDHLVLIVSDLDADVRFYTQILGMEELTFGTGRKALRFGESKINLHQRGRELEPKADRPTPGSADLCLIVEEPIAAVAAELAAAGIAVVDGPVERTGAQGPISSVYVRDPDGNLIELSNYAAGPEG